MKQTGAREEAFNPFEFHNIRNREAYKLFRQRREIDSRPIWRNVFISAISLSEVLVTMATELLPLNLLRLIRTWLPSAKTTGTANGLGVH
jgi:hypothetical protein